MTETNVFDWELMDDVIVCRALPGDVPDATWSAFLAGLQRHKPRAVLVLSAGKSSLTATQRKSAADVLRTLGTLSVVVTDSALTRGLVTAVSWLGANTKSFAWNELEKALPTLAVSPEVHQRLRQYAQVFSARRDTKDATSS